MGDNTKYVAISASTTSGSIHRINRFIMSLPSFLSCHPAQQPESIKRVCHAGRMGTPKGETRSMNSTDIESFFNGSEIPSLPKCCSFRNCVFVFHLRIGTDQEKIV